MSKATKVQKDEPTTTNHDEMLNTLPTKSSKIRYLHNEGFSKGAIAKKLNIRYQHVRNVLVTPLKKAA